MKISVQGGGFRRVLLGNQVLLMECGKCGALWCAAGEVNDLTRLDSVAWAYTARDWQKAYDLDDGVSLRQWHRRQLRSLSRPEKQPD